MSASEVGAQLCEMCREGKNMDAINKLYADNVVSVEASSMEGMPRVMEGIDAVRGKTEWWYANHDVHGGEVKGPFPNGEDEFAVHFKMDVTNKESGQRMDFEEVGGLYGQGRQDRKRGVLLRSLIRLHATACEPVVSQRGGRRGPSG